MVSVRSSIVSFHSVAAEHEDDNVTESDAISLADHDAISWADNEETDDTPGKPLLRKYNVMDICVFFFFFFFFFFLKTKSLIFKTKTFIVGTHKNRLGVVVLTSTHNRSFVAKIRNILTAVNPSFFPIQKVGCECVYILWTCYPDDLASLNIYFQSCLKLFSITPRVVFKQLKY